MLRMIIYYILFILSSQKFLRKTEENRRSFCFTLNSTKSNTDDDIEIFCSGEQCFGIINSGNMGNKFSNITVLCNQKACKIKKNTNNLPEEGECKTNENCKNCFEIILTCYKGNCIGGPIPNNTENNDNNNNKDSTECKCNNNESNNNESNNNESNNKESNNNESNNKESNNNESNNNESNNNESNNN